MAVSETSICNMALGRIGAGSLNNLTTDTSVEAIQCRLHYEPTRDALLRSHKWLFALAQAALSEDIAAPAFGWDNQFVLPADCLRVLNEEDDDDSYEIQGRLLLTDESEVNIRYIKKVTDPTEFDPLFVKALAVKLAVEIVMPLTQDKNLRESLAGELRMVLGEARNVNSIEGQSDRTGNDNSWVNARGGGTVE